MKHREISFPTIVGLLIALGGLLSGLWLVSQQTQESVLATGEEAPIEVRVTNRTNSGFTVSWKTTKSVPGYVQYSDRQGGAEAIAADRRDTQTGSAQAYFTHWVAIEGLKANAEYAFTVGSGGGLYGENGGKQPYLVKTGAEAENFPAADVAYGQIQSSSGEAVPGALVYIQIPGGESQSVLSGADGSWVMSISTVRNEALDKYVEYDGEAGEMEITADGGPGGVARAVVSMNNKSPVPTMVLGQTYNFVLKNEAVASKFTGTATPLMGTSGNNGTVEILVPKAEEKVNSARPEIVGKAPPGTKVTIEIHSETIVSGSATADSTGSFSFTVPQDLPPGEHTITISALIDGVMKKITRSFTVYAVGESSLPSYSATPSATLVPTKKPTPTPTLKPTAVPTPTIKPTAAPTPKVTVVPTVKPTATPTATVKPSPTPLPTRITPVPTVAATMPVAGNAEGTWALLMIGAVMMTGGWWWYRKLA